MIYDWGLVWDRIVGLPGSLIQSCACMHMRTPVDRKENVNGILHEEGREMSTPTLLLEIF